MKKILKLRGDDQKIANGLRMPRTIRRNICVSVGLDWKTYLKAEEILRKKGKVALQTHIGPKYEKS